MNDHTPAPFIEVAQTLLTERGFTSDEGTVWMALRTGQLHLPVRVHTLIRDYIDADIEPHDAMGWFLLRVPPADAMAYDWRHWTPIHLLELRRALYEAEQPPRKALSPLHEQWHEAEWIYSDITPDLAPMCVLAGKDPRGSEAINLKYVDGDTTIVPALRTIAALFRAPALT